MCDCTRACVVARHRVGRKEREIQREKRSGHSLKCHVVEWLLDSVEAARTGVGILVYLSLEPDGGFQA